MMAPPTTAEKMETGMADQEEPIAAEATPLLNAAAAASDDLSLPLSEFRVD